MANFQIKIGQSIEDIKKYVQKNKAKFGEKTSSIMNALNDDVDGKVSNGVELGSYKSLINNSVFSEAEYLGITDPTSVERSIDENGNRQMTIHGYDDANVPVEYVGNNYNGHYTYRHHIDKKGDISDKFNVNNERIIESRRTWCDNDDGSRVEYFDYNFDGIYDYKNIRLSSGETVYYVKTEQGNWQMDMVNR